MTKKEFEKELGLYIKNTYGSVSLENAKQFKQDVMNSSWAIYLNDELKIISTNVGRIVAIKVTDSMDTDYEDAFLYNFDVDRFFREKEEALAVCNDFVRSVLKNKIV